MQKLKLSTMLLFVFGFTGLQAQKTIPASGGDASGSGGSAAYSVGQVVYTTYTGTNGSVAQGVQQPYEISIVFGFEDNLISLNMQAYPNPTTDFLTLTIGASTTLSTQSMNYQLFDISGKLIENKKITNTTETIRMENLPSATYFLKVTNNKEVKTFKILKN